MIKNGEMKMGLLNMLKGKERKETLEDLYNQILENNSSKFSTLLFNLYEDEDCYTVEAVFDDDAFIIGREKPYFIANNDINYTIILESFKTRLEKFYLENHNKLNNLKEISYGFVDGDLYYIKKNKKKRNDIKVTMEELEALNDQKLLAWITVYTDGEKRKENGINSFSRELTTEERNEYIKFLYENFKIKDK